MNKNIVDLGFINIKWYAFLIVIGLVVGLILFLKNKKIEALNKQELMYDYLFWLAIFGFFGARIWYVVFQYGYYVKNLPEIFAIWNGGLAIHGGIIGGLLYTYYFAKKNKINMFILTDALVPAILFGQAIGRWGNFVNQEAYGTAISRGFLSNTLHLPRFIVEGMKINGIYHQPTFLYESLWNLLGFAVVYTVIRNQKVGYRTAFYLIWYGIIRYFIEGIRTDALMLGDLRIAKLMSVVFILAGIYLAVVLHRKYKKGSKR